MMTEEDIKDIRINYGVDQPNDSFINDIVCNIIDDDVFEVQGFSLEFCNTPKERIFWKKNIINKYVYLFPYLVINQWQINAPANEELSKWIESFLKENVIDEKGKTFDDKLYDEVKLFKEDTTIIHEIPDVLPQIGFILDSFLWQYHKENLYFIRYIEGKLPVTDALYNNYLQLFKKQIYAYNLEYIRFNIVFILDYCKAIDLIFHQNGCFLSLIEKFSTSDNRNMRLPSLLKTISQNRCDIETMKHVLSYYCVNIGTYMDSSDTEIQFCRTSDDALFWKDLISAIECKTFLVYLFLRQWSAESSEVCEPNMWLGLFQSGQHMAVLESEMWDVKKSFKESIQFIPKAIGEYVGYVIDIYLWEKYVEIPAFINNWETKNPFLQHYREILINCVRKDKPHYINNVGSYLQYCLLIDSSIEKEKLTFIDVLESTCDNESDDLKNILLSYPYYGDDFGLTLLDFCIHNSSLYKLSNTTISKFKFRLYVDSWMSVIRDRLGNNGKPYNVELCERTFSYMRIVEYIDSRHPIFWDKCNRKADQVINDIKKRDPAGKREPVRDNVQNETHELSKKEKEIIFNNIKSFLSNTLKEGIEIFINEIKEEEENNGKKIEMTKEVLQVLYRYLLNNYANKPLPEFSFETSASFYFYADRVARVWVFWWACADDSINSSESVTNEQLESIKEKFDTYVWNPIKNDILAWCRSYYSAGDSSYSSTSSMDYNDYDNDDYGLKGSERVG